MSKNARTTAAYTTEFHHEFRVETGRLLRRRFLWFSGVVGVFGVLSLAFVLAALVLSLRTPVAERPPVASKTLFDWRFWLLSIAWVSTYASSFAFAFKRRPADQVLLRLSFWLVAVDGLLNVLMRSMELEGALGLGSFFITHVVACAFLPWTAWQALRPMILVLAANAAVVLLYSEPIWKGGPAPATIAELAASPLLAIPGTVWCWMRHSKRTQDFKYRFMTTRYSEMRRELVDARRIHESLFPEPIQDGALHLAFDYEPMRQIGGDFLYANRRSAADPFSPVSVVLLDVTGHGIPAALTVNRLHGEMERVFAENPDIGPGEVLGLLNRYVHLTLATHSIYVTAFCARIDPDRSVLEYASGGHPPAFIRAVDGTIDELNSTSFVLGACPDGAFDPAPRQLAFGPGDTLIAYTDGAIEATASDGRMLRIEGLRRLVATVDRDTPLRWSEQLRERIASYRGGPPADDTLFLTLHRPVGAIRENAPAKVPGRAAGVSA